MRNWLRRTCLKNSGASMSRSRTVQISGLQRAGPASATDSAAEIALLLQGLGVISDLGA